jgi:hypothetical protein
MPDDGELYEEWMDAPRDPVILRGGPWEVVGLGSRIAVFDPENTDCWLTGRPLDLPAWA